MRDDLLRKAADLQGGVLDPKMAQGVFSARDLDRIWEVGQALLRLGSQLTHVNGTPEIGVAVTNGTWGGVRVHRLGDGDFAILVPVGLLARLAILYRLLQTYTGRSEPQSVIDVVFSLEEDPYAQRQTPPQLHPLFRDSTDVSLWWTAMRSLNEQVFSDSGNDKAVDLVIQSQHFIFLHEIAHVIRRHAQVKSDLAGDPRQEHATYERAHRALELDADRIASQCMGISLGDVDVDTRSRWLKLMGFAVSGTLTLFDPQHLRVFDETLTTEHYHPVIRQFFILGQIAQGLQRRNPETDGQKRLDEGADVFDKLMKLLEADAFVGRFGPWDSCGGPPVVNTLRRGAFHPTADDEFGRAAKDLSWANDVIEGYFGRTILNV